jgi:hypothetical protein
MEFLRAGFALAGVKAVYSLNKTSTRAHIEKVAKELKAKRAEVCVRACGVFFKQNVDAHLYQEGGRAEAGGMCACAQCIL